MTHAAGHLQRPIEAAGIVDGHGGAFIHRIQGIHSSPDRRRRPVGGTADGGAGAGAGGPGSGPVVMAGRMHWWRKLGGRGGRTRDGSERNRVEICVSRKRAFRTVKGRDFPLWRPEPSRSPSLLGEPVSELKHLCYVLRKTRSTHSDCVPAFVCVT